MTCICCKFRISVHQATCMSLGFFSLSAFSLGFSHFCFCLSLCVSIYTSPNTHAATLLFVVIKHSITAFIYSFYIYMMVDCHD